MSLKTIDQHNNEVINRVHAPNLTGVECPNCKTELFFEGWELLLSSPPQRNVKCFNCGLTDRIYV